MLGGVTHQAVDGLDGAREVLVVGDAPPAIWHAGGLAIVLVHIDEVDVAGDVQLAGTQFAHADDPQLHGLVLRAARCAMAFVQFAARLLAGAVQGQLGQFGHGPGDVGQGCLCLAVQLDQPFHDQLAQHPQRGARVAAACAQSVVGLLHGRQHRDARWQQRQVVGVAAVQALVEAGMLGQRPLGQGLVTAGVRQRRMHGSHSRMLGTRGAGLGAWLHTKAHWVRGSRVNPRQGCGS